MHGRVHQVTLWNHSPQLLYPNYSAVSGEKLIFQQSWWGNWKNQEDAVNPLSTAGLQADEQTQRKEMRCQWATVSSPGWFESVLCWGQRQEPSRGFQQPAWGDEGQRRRNRSEWKHTTRQHLYPDIKEVWRQCHSAFPLYSMHRTKSFTNPKYVCKGTTLSSQKAQSHTCVAQCHIAWCHTII